MVVTNGVRLWLLAGLAVLAIAFLREPLLLCFAGILVAVFLTGIARAVTAPKLPYAWALAIVIIGLTAMAAGAGWYAADDVVHEADALIERMPRLIDDVTASFREYAVGRWLLARGDDIEAWLDTESSLRSATTVLGSTMGMIGAMLVTLFLGLFMAAEPAAYVRGCIRLAPIHLRPRMQQVLLAIGQALRGWIIGKVIAMLVILVATWIGLVSMGMPLALVLATTAALLTFVPNFGPVIAAVPALLLATAEGTGTVIGVLALYTGIQAIESYVLTPLIQRKAVSLPPAVTLIAQVMMGVLAGPLGIVLATPLAVVALTIGRELTPAVDERASSAT